MAISNAKLKNSVKSHPELQTLRFPAPDGTMFSQRKNFCPTAPPFVTVPVDRYTQIVGEQKMERLLKTAEKLKGLKILELNSAALGGGVAEMLLSSVPFLNQLGIDDEWRVIKGSEPFFEVTKCIHNLLQGKGACFTTEMERVYFETLTSDSNIDVASYHPDIILAHDPQPLGLLPNLREKNRAHEKWLWRCHIDMDEDSLSANPALERFIEYWMDYYDGTIFSAAHYIICRWPVPKFIIPPFIDPLSEKNRELSQTEIDSVLNQHGIDPEKLIIAQIGRFDPWKGLGRTIETYRLVKERVDCQLILAGGLAGDDPEAASVLAEIYNKVDDDPDIHVLNLPPTSGLDINAIQRASRVILQPSIREGFGLTVTEALWKKKPVIASPVGGIALQLRDGEFGYFYQEAPDSAEKIIYLLTHPQAAEFMGRQGKAYVRDHFLMPDRITDYLKTILIMMETSLDPESIISFHSWHKLARRR